MASFPFHRWPNATPPKARCLVEAICCPLCTSLSVTKDRCARGGLIARWTCGDCNHRWREPIEHGRTRATLA